MSSGKSKRSEGKREENAADPPEQHSLGRRAWEQISTLAFAILIALSIRAFVIEPFRIPSGSMLPTLLIGDHLFVNKFLYGARIPFTDWRLPAIREPERGDVVVFSVARVPAPNGRIYPADERPDLPRDDFVKRIVALPGDRVEIKRGRLLVNGEPVESLETQESFVDEGGRKLSVLVEELGACEHLVLDDPGRQGPERAAFVVPPDRYFMMGDNRDHSNDSRSWGTVHFDEFKGPAFILYWSWDVNGNFLQFLNPINWFTADKRWGRVFQRVKCEEPGAAARNGQAG